MHFCQPPSGGFEIGFSQARGLESIDKPHKWGSGIKIRLYQLLKKGKTDHRAFPGVQNRD